jgi:hypothetical protein
MSVYFISYVLILSCVLNISTRPKFMYKNSLISRILLSHRVSIYYPAILTISVLSTRALTLQELHHIIDTHPISPLVEHFLLALNALININ